MPSAQKSVPEGGNGGYRATCALVDVCSYYQREGDQSRYLGHSFRVCGVMYLNSPRQPFDGDVLN